MRILMVTVFALIPHAQLLSMAGTLAQSLRIQQIHSFNQAMDDLSLADKDTLVVIDVDYTTIVPDTMLCWGNDRCVHRNNHRGHEWLPELIDECFANKNTSLLRYQSIWHAQEKPVLVEPGLLELILSLQKREVKVVALTAIPTGSYETIPSLPIWRYTMLQRCGIDFNLISIGDFFLNTMKTEDGTMPLFYKGILCSGSFSKGKVLSAFFQHAKWTPNNVIAFDDTLNQVLAIAREMRHTKIPCSSYEYLGAYDLPNILDKEVVTLQLKHLAEHHEWLQKDKARALLGK